MLLADAFLIDCTGADPRERASVLVEDGEGRLDRENDLLVVPDHSGPPEA